MKARFERSNGQSRTIFSVLFFFFKKLTPLLRIWLTRWFYSTAYGRQIVLSTSPWKIAAPLSARSIFPANKEKARI